MRQGDERNPHFHLSFNTNALLLRQQLSFEKSSVPLFTLDFKSRRWTDISLDRLLAIFEYFPRIIPLVNHIQKGGGLFTRINEVG